MALVKKLEQITMERNSVHGPTSATFSVFKGPDGLKYLQIDTYGSDHRQFPDKKSQSIQFGPDGVAELQKILSSL